MKLEGKVVVVTGAASGIGSATCELLGKEGAVIAAFDKDEKRGRKLNEALRGMGIESLFIQVDVRHAKDVSDAIEMVKNKFCRIDILFNNSGVRPRAFFTSISEEDWDLTFDVNVKGMFLVSKATIPIMRQQGVGIIINTASELALIGYPGLAAYAASKAAVVSITKTMALECASMGIRVNSISPGPVDTPMLWRDRQDTFQSREVLSARQPLHRIGKPEEIAKTVLFLASDDSAFFTGSNLVVDGGFTAGIIPTLQEGLHVAS